MLFLNAFDLIPLPPAPFPHGRRGKTSLVTHVDTLVTDLPRITKYAK
jgi:hypothetical protein